MVALGRRLAEAIGETGACIYLRGDLGAGKTTLSRGIVTGFGHQGAVKSPTYTLVEPYQLATKNIYHFDLYRLASAQELDFLGVDDYLAQQGALLLFEWPEKGDGFIPHADLELLIREDASDGDKRNLQICAQSSVGEQIVEILRRTQDHSGERH